MGLALQGGTWRDVLGRKLSQLSGLGLLNVEEILRAIAQVSLLALRCIGWLEKGAAAIRVLAIRLPSSAFP